LVSIFIATRDLVTLSVYRIEPAPIGGGLADFVVDWRLLGQLEATDELYFVIEGSGFFGDSRRLAILLPTHGRKDGTLRIDVTRVPLGNCLMFVEKGRIGHRFEQRRRVSKVLRFRWTGAGFSGVSR
jgi:hypothetical protein